MKTIVYVGIFIAAILLISPIVSQVEALSKTEKKINKFLRANTEGGSKMTDLCSVTALTENGKKNVTLELKECIVKEPPQTECGPNEVWNGQTCECKDGFHQDESESCVPDVVVPPVTNDTETPPPIDNETAPPHCENGFIWNGTACNPEPMIPTCDTGEFYNTTSELCQSIPVIEPEPTPNGTEIKVVGVGDVECSGDGVKVLNQIKAENPNLVVGLGDLCYDSSASNFISTWGPLGNLLACLIGNHEAENEDGSATLQQAFLKYCGDNYTIKVGSVLIVGLNTNGDLNAQKNGAVSILSNATFMQPFDTVVVASHKPICMAAPDAHHPVDEDAKAKAVKTAFCEPIKQAVGDKADLIFLNGHNHYMAKAVKDGITYVESGAGGKSHYNCSTDATFTFCNDTKYGYWILTVSSDGVQTNQFKDMNGGVVN